MRAYPLLLRELSSGSASASACPEQLHAVRWQQVIGSSELLQGHWPFQANLEI